MTKRKRKRINRNQRRAVIYIRYSTPKQSDGYSIEYQLEQAHAYAEKHGYTIVGEYIDKAKTAKDTAGRDSLEQMLNDAEEDIYDVIIVFSFNRAFRNTLDALSTHTMLKEKHGIILLSCIEHVDTTNPHGMFAATNLFAMHQLSSEITAEHVKAAMYYAVQHGYYMGGPVPFGYITVGTGEFNKGRERKRYEIDEHYAPMIRSIYDMYISGLGTPAITTQIYLDGWRSKKGTPISISAVQKILQKSNYAGISTHYFEGYEPIVVKNLFPPIISEETYEKAKKIRTGKTTRPRFYNKDHLFFLSGKIKCGTCGCVFQSTSCRPKQTKPRYRYYACLSRTKPTLEACGTLRIRAEKLHEYVMDAIAEHILNKDAIKSMATEITAIAKSQKNKTVDIDALKKQRDTLYSAMSKLIDDKAFSRLPQHLIEEKEKQYSQELFALEQQIKQHESNGKPICENDVIKFITELTKQDTNNIMGEKAIFDTFVKSIIVTNDKTIVNLIIPTSPLVMHKGAYGEPIDHLYIKTIILEI